MNEVKLKIRLSIEERDLVLQHAFPSAALESKLRFGLRDGKFLTFTLDWDDAEGLAGCVAAEANHAKDRKLRRRFERLSDRIEDTLRKVTAIHAQGVQVRPGTMPAQLREEIQRLLDSSEFSSLDEVNAELAKLNEAHNRRPREEFQGLSPEQVNRLIYSEWESPEAGMRCREDLTLEEANRSEIFHNARVFLKALLEEGRAKSTTTGNLSRKFVTAMVDAMRWPEGFTEELWLYNKVLNEQDVVPLNVLRIVLEAAGFIRKQKGHFQVTKKGASLLDDEKAGALYVGLFRTFFTRYNLAYGDRIPEYPEVQQTVRYSLYVLGSAAREWRSLEELAPIAFLPKVAEELHPGVYTDTAQLLLEMRLVRPLERFGLVECTRETRKHFTFASIERIRTTPLYQKFLHFTLGN